MKSVATILLLLFVAASVTYLVVGEARSTAVSLDPSTTAEEQPQPVAGEPPWAHAEPANGKQTPVLQAYYFHVTSRCTTCLKIEQFARETIEEAYSSELEDGRVRWQAVNYDEPANEHFVKEYGLVSSSLVIVSNPVGSPGSWRKLDRTWDLVSDEKAFKNYVAGEIKTLLRRDP